MKKVKNDSQPFISYIIPIFVLPILAQCMVIEEQNKLSLRSNFYDNYYRKK